MALLGQLRSPWAPPAVAAALPEELPARLTGAALVVCGSVVVVNVS